VETGGAIAVSGVLLVTGCGAGGCCLCNLCIHHAGNEEDVDGTMEKDEDLDIGSALRRRGSGSEWISVCSYIF